MEASGMERADFRVFMMRHAVYYAQKNREKPPVWLIVNEYSRVVADSANGEYEDDILSSQAIDDIKCDLGYDAGWIYKDIADKLRELQAAQESAK